ncbi:hypothetical protein AMS68_007437 [Peltaster fructicola]|uniref:Uncharacterized protein n=1 Tax=Peltaster fructicola TaxID=286661 RepID=A0A6H0Y5Q1_9PEZI|nr:hypothetical protein AMS68_007437 [Peltaster fructicola]
MSRQWASMVRQEEDFEACPTNNLVIETLQDLFDEQLTVHQASENLKTNNNIPPADGLVGKTLFMIIDAAKKHPEQHERLADLLIALGAEDRESKGVDMMRADRWNTWAGLPRFGMDMREEMNDDDIPRAGPHRDAQIERWKNLCRFQAVLTSTDVAVLSFRLFALWTLRECLEYPVEAHTVNEGDAAGVDLDAKIPGAAMWPIVLGDKLQRWTDAPGDRLKNNVGHGGPLWTGIADFSMDRLRFWKERFTYIAELPHLKTTTTELARSAAEHIVA